MMPDFSTSTTPEPRFGGGVSGPAINSSRSRGWRRIAALNAWIDDSWIGALIGVVALFSGLVALIFIAGGLGG